MAFDEQMQIAYRHDAHKMRGRSHDAGSRQLHGVTVDEDVPYGADADASSMSRPGGKPRQTLEGHDTHYRRSVLTGTTAYDPDTFALHHYDEELGELLTAGSAVEMHTAWLNHEVVAAFNESVYYPYTSLKYHTLLVAAVLDNYRDGNGYSDLCLCVDRPSKIVPHRTVFATSNWSLTITGDPDDHDGFGRLGDRPWRNWHSVWGRLTMHPLDAEKEYDRVLDAQLRRIQAWSTALQLLDDVLNREVAYGASRSAVRA